jgi:succinoglycan biosynthesis transport protein ExoP
VSVVTDNPKRAAQIADAYANAYLEVSRRQSVGTLVAATEQLGAKITALEREMETIDRQIAAAPSGSPLVSSLSSQRSQVATQVVNFKQKLNQLQVDTSLKTGGSQLLAPAAVPGSPASPQPRRNGAVAGALGLLLGVGLAYVRDHFDDTITTKDDLERTLPGVPVLGIIPPLRGREGSLAVADGHTPAAEAYRGLRTSIQFRSLDRPLRTLQVTSPRLGDGKSTTVANLGMAFARAGVRVTIVSCDMRRPRVHEYFGLSTDIGFTSVLLGDIPLSRAIQPVRGEERLQVVSSGPIPPNPSELLSIPRTDEVLSSLQSTSDVVLLDSPPVLPVADATALAGRVDGVLLVVRAGKTTRRELQRAVELLTQVGASIVGTVFAGSGDEGRGRYYYAAYKAADGARRMPESSARVAIGARGGGLTQEAGQSEREATVTQTRRSLFGPRR